MLPLNCKYLTEQYNLIIFLTDMRPNIDLNKDKEGELYEEYASSTARLKWSGIESDLLLQGGSDLVTLRSIRNVLLSLQQEFSSEEGPRIVFDAQRRDDLSKRLLLIESEVDGLLRRRINYSVTDQNLGERYLDYTGLLNQKQNQIVQLQKKINNLQQRLRRATQRQIQLENHILSLTKQLQVKENIINAKNQIILAEVASTNAMRQSINRLKKNFEINRSRIGDLERVILDGVNISEIGSFEIRADTLTKDGAQSRSRTYADSPQEQKLKTKVIQMFREFEKLFTRAGGAITGSIQGQVQAVAITQDDVLRIVEGFLTEFKGTRLYQDVQSLQRRIKSEQDLSRLRQNFAAAASIYQQGIEQLKIDNPGIRINMERNLFDILQRQKIHAYKTQKGSIFVSDFTQRTVQVPVQDARTKHLLHLFASQLKRLFLKYPKLQGQINQRVAQFFQQQIIDLIEVDEVDRLVEIVKYRPQVVKVQNVYAYSSQKSRKVQFHLRVLIKALLEQLERVRVKSGIIPEMDEGVVGMIKQQIMGVVNVDDILKVFRVVPKIVEVEKVVQKVVQRIVQVPQIVTIDRIVEKIVQVQKIRQVQRIVNVPLEQPIVYDRQVQKIVPIENIIERVVQVPTIVQRLVQVIKQVPKIVQVEVFRQNIVQVQKIVQVQRVVNHIQKQYEQIELIQQKIVPMQKIVQRIVQVPYYVEKIVEKVVQIPKIIQVEKIVQKIVPVVQYRNAREVLNHIEIQHQIVQRIIQKPVPIIQIVERIVEVPQVIQKIVQVVHVETRIQQRQVIRQKIVVEERIKQVQKIVTQIVEVVKQVPREIQKIIQIPVIHERLVVVTQFIQKPIISRIQTTTIKQVYLRDPLIIKQPKIVQVEKIINHYIQVPKPFKYVEQKIVQVPRIVDRIKQVRVQVEKLVEKMVQVPKVVQVQKVVQKIVVVPRVIEKVIQIPQIVEKIVQKEVIKQVIREVQRRVQVLVYQDKPFEVEVQKNVFIQVQKVVDRIVDKLVEVPKFEQVIQIKQIVQEKVIEVVKQIPKIIEVQKVVTLFSEQLQLIEIQKPVITPVEVPVPVDRIVQKLVILQNIQQRIVQVPQVVEKIVSIKQQEIVIKQIQKIVQKVVVDQRIKQVERIIPVMQEVIKQVPTIVQKIVPVYSTVQQIITAQQIVQKIVQKTVTVPKVYEVQRLREVLVQIPKFIQIEKIVPQLVRVNNYIQKIVQKIVQVPMIIQQLKEIQKEVQKIVKVQSHSKQIVEVQRVVEKIVVMEKMKQIVRNVNHIQKILEVVDRLEQLAPVEIVSREEIIVQVPYILQKIVQKIVVMPQIVQVLKYIHEITEVEDIGVAVDVQTSTYEQRYKALSKNIKTELDVLIRQLRGMRNPQWNARIDIIEKFLAEFQKFILNPRIIKIPQKQVVERPVQVERIVTVPTQDQKSLRMELTLSLLVQKLILELKRIRETSKIDLMLDEDIKLIFFAELKTQSQLEGALAQQIRSYSNKVMRQFQSLGNWSVQHQLMLNSFLQERFLMAELVHNANLQIEKALATGQKRLQALRRYKKDRTAFQGYLKQIAQTIGGLNVQIKGQLGGVLQVLGQFQGYSHQYHQQPVRVVGQLIVQDQRIQSMLRQKQEQIYRLKDLLTRSGLSIDGSLKGVSGKNTFQQLNKLKLQNGELKAYIKTLEAKIGLSDLESQLGPFREQIRQLQEINLNLQTQISDYRSSLINLQAQNRVLKELSGDTGRFLTDSTSIDIGIKGGDLARTNLQMQGGGQGAGSVSGARYGNQRYGGIEGSARYSSGGQSAARYGSNTGIQGATITTSALKTGSNNESMIKSPQSSKLYQSPSVMKMGQSRFDRSYDMSHDLSGMSLGSQQGTPGSTTRQFKRQEPKKDQYRRY